MKIKISIIGFLMFFAFLSHAKSDTLIPYRIGSKWGFSDYSGNIKIEAKYDRVEFFNNYNFHSKNYAKVFKNNKVGIIDSNGKYLIPIYAQNIETMEFFREYKDAFLLKVNGFYGVVNYNNKLIIPFEYDKIQIKKLDEDFNKYGFLAKKGEEYYSFSSNGERIKHDFAPSENIEKMGSDAGSGYDKFGRSSSDEQFLIKKNKDFILAKNKNIFDSIGEVTYGDFITIYFEGKVGLVDQKELLEAGKIANYINPIYDKVAYPVKSYKKTPELFFMELNDSTEIYNSGREEHYNHKNTDPNFVGFLSPYKVMPFKAFRVVNISGNNLKTYKSSKFGYYILNKHKEIPPIYDSIDILEFHNHFPSIWKVSLNGKMGYINEDGFQYFREE